MTHRIDLPSGGWAEIDDRPLKVRDLKELRKIGLARGWGVDDPAMGGMDLALARVTAWSFGEVAEDVYDDLDLGDMNAISEALPKGEANSTSSSAGGTPSPSTEEPSLTDG